MTTSEREAPSLEEVLRLRKERRNWGRWGDDDQRGAVNLITPKKRAAAAALVRSGRSVSLSRDFPTMPARNNPVPAQHFMRWWSGERRGGAVDYVGISYHGYSATHIDALCHVWDEDGLWNGRDPEKEITSNGARWGGIQHWRDGIITRGVLLDVPKHRGEPSVTLGKPVHGWELEATAEDQGVTLEAGDALVVYSGRETWHADHPDWTGGEPQSPGLHASCLEFLRDKDVSVLVWDFMDAYPDDHGLHWPVHAALFSYGVALVDNALLQPLAEACAEEGRYEFMLVVAPLVVVGGTGSPANPLAVF